VVAALATLDAQPPPVASPSQSPAGSDPQAQARPAPARDGAGRREPPPPQPRDSRIVQLASDAETLPPEFAADALIRIAASARVTDNAWKSALLTQAFFKSYSVREAYRRSTPQSIPIDTRQGAQLMASAMSLNRLSLQVRTAQLMAFVDPRRARELFEWIDVDVTAGPCEDPLVPAIDEYYTALSLLARQTFGGNHDEALRFFEIYLWRARLPSEMPAVARAMVRFNPSPAETPYFETLFSTILETGATDARGFSAAASDIVSRTADFQVFEAKAGLRGIHLMDSLRAYLVSQMKGPRCADSFSESMTPSAFNAVLRRADLTYEVKTIDQPIAPSRMLGPMRIDPFWQTPEAGALHTLLMQLRGSGRDPPPLKVRETPEWRSEADKALVAVELWTARSEALERDALAEKSLLYLALLDLIPPSTLRTKAIQSFVDYLRHADRNSEDRGLWFAFVNRLLELSRGNDRDDVLDAFVNAHHPVLAVYAQLERLVPPAAR
jgi:hypothetical protein